MKTAAVAFAVVLSMFGLNWVRPATAQVATDGSLSTRVNSTDNLNFVVEDGDRAGTNLFHSFRELSVPNGGSIHFNNADDVRNIFSRVTGGSVSNINGIIRANGTANLFLLNPSGILFGPNAALNIGGSFLGTTANSIRFADGVEFSAANSTTPSLLTVSTPVGLQMGTAPGRIQVTNSGHQLTLVASGARPISRGQTPPGLQVQSGQTLALIGGTVDLAGGILSAPAGHLELGSVQSGSVNLAPTDRGWTFTYAPGNQFQDIRLSQRALIDANGDGGSLQLRGQNIFFSDGSTALIQHSGTQRGRDAILNATDLISFQQSQPNSFETRIEAQTLGTGSTGELQITARRLQVQNSSMINQATYNSGGSGAIRVNVAESIALFGVLPGDTTSVVSRIGSGGVVGNAGDIFISTGQLSLRDGGQIFSNTFLQASNSGNIAIQATESIEVVGGKPNLVNSGISTSTLALGNAGNLTINTPRLSVREGGRVTSSTLTRGNAGSVTINTSESVEVSGISTDQLQTPSLVSASALSGNSFQQRIFSLPAIPSGNAGSVTINTPELAVSAGAQVGVDNAGSGNAGNLTIASDRIRLDSAGRLTAATVSGEGGNIALNVREALTLRQGSRIESQAGGTGNGGNVTIRAAELAMRQGSTITTSATGSGSGGDINLRVDRLLQMAGSSISASTAGQGNGGRVQIAANQLDLLNSGQINATAAGTGSAGSLTLRVSQLNLNRGQIAVEATGTGNAGKLNVTADQVALEGSRINATTQTGRGGDVQLTVRDRLSLDRDSSITADARRSGRSGNIRLTTANLNLNRGSNITTNVQGSATGGNLFVTGDRLSLFGGSSLSAVTGGTGNAGSVQVTVKDIEISGVANTQIAGVGTTPTPSFIGSGTFPGSRGRGGSLTVTGDRIRISDGGLISAGTSGAGTAGDVNIRANELIAVTGVSALPAPFFGYRTSHPSRISASSLSNAAAGSVQIQTPLLNVSNGAVVEVSGAGRGGAGNLEVNADRISLDNRAVLSAEVAGGDRGNITLNTPLLFLQRGSQITTNATGAASGGNIVLNADFIVGLENSDIVARAEQGAGGNIAIATQGLIGIAPRPELTSQSDINASSQLGLNGTVDISTPNVDVTSGLSVLPTEVVDASQQVAQTCADVQRSRFVATGRGGIPENPTRGVGSDRPWSDLRDLSAHTGTAPSTAASAPDTQQAIVEATELTVNAQGQTVLIASTAGQIQTNAPATCSAVN